MTRPPSWIQAIEPQLKELLDLPNVPFSFPFSFEALSTFISSQLTVSPLTFALGSLDWKTRENFFTGLGTSPVSISLQASPLKGDCFWVMPYEDVKTFISWIKDRNEKALELDNPELIKGIYRYALLVALEGLSQPGLFDQFSLKLTKDTKFEEKGYTLDVSITHNEKQIWGRIILSPEFKESFMNFFSKDKLSFFDITKQFPSLKIPLSIVNGSIELSQEDLQSLQEGDFVIVDNAHFKPSDEKGSMQMLVQEKPLFQIKLKEGKFKILDFIYAYEEASV